MESNYQNFFNIHMKVVVLTLTIILIGCATSENNIYGGLNGQSVVGNKSYVSINNVWTEMDALPLAEKHCATYGKTARFFKMQGYRAIFDCVE